MENFSDYIAYIIYLDENGFPVLDADQKQFSKLVLACVLINKKTYTEHIIPAVQKFKFKYFGHDQTILRERDIREQTGEFTFLQNDKKLQKNFLSDLSHLIDHDFEILICVIDKTTLTRKRPKPFSPYNLALLFSMEHLSERMKKFGQQGKIIQIIAESRGKEDDEKLESEFKRIANGITLLPSEQADLLKEFDWQILFSDEKTNSTGLQLADLVAHPIGVNVLQTKESLWPTKYWCVGNMSDRKPFDIIKENVPFWLKAFP